ncbi:ribonuclease E [Nocardioides ginsengisegetis]|uniref:Ribonuclease E n=1 Tax=Nocardioides ginsengisegetis TaxID=661491 RepID=A0A7W3J0V2_9ACTN|nr:Rne/Rng family ribonuclease [Nocardioides ginsengisegetis]MBA8804261.1 ribonuclease E [Nocardioides ginsengisegetis]
MPDENPVGNQTPAPEIPAADAVEASSEGSEGTAPAKKAAAKKTAAKKTAAKKTTTPRKTAAKKVAASAEELPLEVPAPEGEPAAAAPAKKTAKKAAAKKTTAKKASTKKAAEVPAETPVEAPAPVAESEATAAAPVAAVLFQAPDAAKAPARRTRKAAQPKPEATAPAEEPTAAPAPEPAQESAEESAKPTVKTTTRTRTRTPKKVAEPAPVEDEDETTDEPQPEPDEAEGQTDSQADDSDDSDESDGEGGGGRRRRRRGGRRRRKSGDGESGGNDDHGQSDSQGGQSNQGGQGGQSRQAKQDGNANSNGPESDAEQDADEGGEGTSRRRRRRRRSGDDGGEPGDDPENTVTRVRRPRSAEDEITAISGSTRLEAKKQRRRDGREAGRRRAPIVSEAEFLARRESVDRVMVIRQRDELTQIGVLEDKVLVEHYVARESQTSLIGNVYLGRVQNVLPSMEAAFIDIGKGRNAVLYAGEVNWSALGHREGQPRKIESVLTSGQTVLVQVTKDPIGHKGARLTSQISLAGRFLVYVPDGTTSGISRKLPDTERNRLKALLKEIVPDTAGVIVRTAAEGASEDELTRDVERLKARWEDIEGKVKGSAPQLLYGEPDLTLKVVRDLFTEDFTKLVIEGDDAWDTVQNYVHHVAPDLEERLERFESPNGKDIFATYRVDEQIAKGLDRKVWLPSGGSLIIDRTEAMTVVDVNTGKFTGSGGNLEETVTKNNLEAAEEMVRQLRLRDIGGIIVIDFIDMVLESNRDLVLRRLVECLGRDRTRHQVAEVTSLGLVQMTRKRIGTGLVESFSENCEHCQGRGVVIHDAPVEPRKPEDESRRGGRRTRGGRGRGEGENEQGGQNGNQGNQGNQGGQGGRGGQQGGQQAKGGTPSPKDIAAHAKHEHDHTEHEHAEAPAEQMPEVEAAPVAETPSETPSETPVETPAQPAAEKPVEKPVEKPAEEAPAEPAAPQVVTRTRRRAASRPAGQPETQSAPQPVVVEAAPAAAVETPAAPPVAPVAAPKVVTRTRGRSATRPAGPPVGAPASAGGTVPAMPDVSATTPPGSVGSVGHPSPDGLVEPGAASTEPGHDAEAHHVEHVPIKKKGQRKR